MELAGYGLLAAAVRSHVLERARVVTWLRRTFAVTCLALAGQTGAVSR